MPQITSCPECSKKLRVPDELIGKKVKCPGCTTMFIAEADDQDEAPPPPKKAPPKPPERSRNDAVASSPRAKRRDDDEEEEEAPRPRAKKRDEEEEDERPARRKESIQEESRRPAPRRDDDEEEDRKPRRGRGRDEEDEEEDRKPRGRRDEEDEEERRPRRSRDRDDDDDDEDRPSRRRRDEASEEEQVRGWQKVRTGLNFVAISGWINLSVIGLALLAAGSLFLMGGSLIASLFGGGTPASAASGLGGLVVLMCGFYIIAGLLNLTSFVLLMVGVGFCMATPKLRAQSMKGMAMTAFYLYIGSIGAYLFGALLIQISPGVAIVGGLISLAAMLAVFAGHIIWMLYLRQVCVYFRDTALAGTVLTNLIVQIVGPIVAILVLFVLGLILGASGAVGSMLVVMMIFYGLFILGMIGVVVWYILTVQKVRDLVEYKGT